MKDFVEQEKLRVEEFLKDSVEHQDKKVDYVLYKEETKETNVLASDSSGEVAIEFTPTTKDYDGGYVNVPEWDFNFDYYIYNLLEEGWKIGFMSDEVHYSIWNSITELYPEDIDYKDGVQNYLQYCADNKITKEYLDEKVKNSIPNADTPDIMKYFEGIALYERMEYKGYIIEADDSNLDNPKENLVHIYENEQDYINGEEIETVSLKTIGLKQNIKEYIDEFYYENKSYESEKSYFTFVLGYDLLNDMLSKSSTPENDVSYDFCNMIASQYLESPEYRNEKYSAYEMLVQWLNDNKERVQKEYNEFIGVENKEIHFENGMTALEFGKRNQERVALVQHNFKDGGYEYIIAFNYEAKDNKLEWGYGYYYSTDIDKAREDFNKVLAGENLADTFNQDNKKELKVVLIGIDNWDRPVFKDEKGNLYKDTNLGTGCLALCTACNNDFYGEPEVPLNDNIEINIVKSFNKNKNKENER